MSKKKGLKMPSSLLVVKEVSGAMYSVCHKSRVLHDTLIIVQRTANMIPEVYPVYFTVFM